MSDTPFADRALLARMVEADFGRGDAEARARLTALLDHDPDAQARHDEVQFLWDMLGEVDPPVVAPRPVAAPSLEPHDAGRRSPFGKRLAGRAVAACLVCGVIAAAIVGLGGTSGTARAFTIETGKAERRIADLPDGSTVELSGETRVTVDFASGRRLLSVDNGEVYVRVTPGHIPLVVQAGVGTMRVSGAADVNLRRSDVVVTLVTGSAEVVVAGARIAVPQSTRLAQGQQLRFGALAGAAPGSMMTTPRTVDAASALDWTRGLLEFHGEPLADVIDEVNRHAAGRIVLLDQGQADMPVYGVLHIGDLDGLASMLRDQQMARGKTADIVRVDAAPD